MCAAFERTASRRGAEPAIDFPEDASVVSYLPMAHIAERNSSHYLGMILGFTVTCCPSPQEIFALLQAVHPSWFFGVPRISEKLRGRMELDLAEADAAAARRALDRAWGEVRRAGDAPPPADAIQGRLTADERAALAALRHRHGLDRLRAANIGAAPSPTPPLEFFHAAGVPLGELWGTSETTGLGTACPPRAVRFATVGPPAPGVELVIADDGEVLVRGAVVTAGYHGRPGETAAAIDPDGRLHTGDLGELDDAG